MKNENSIENIVKFIFIFVPLSPAIIPAQIILDHNRKYKTYYKPYTYTVLEPDRETFVKVHRDKWIRNLKPTYKKIREQLEFTGVLANWIKARFALELMASVGYGVYLNSDDQLADLKELLDITKRLNLPDMSNSEQFTDTEIEELSYFLKSIRAFSMEKAPLLIPSEEVFDGEDIGLGFPAARRQAIEKASYYNLLDPNNKQLSGNPPSDGSY